MKNLFNWGLDLLSQLQPLPEEPTGVHYGHPVKNKPILVEGDLLNFPDADVIGHQTNCFAQSAEECGGLAGYLFRKMPWAIPSKVSPDLYGDYTLIKNPEDAGKGIVNLYGQYHGGSFQDGTKDSKEARLNALRSALEKFLSEESPKTLALPYKIGCGIAGGDWKTQYQMICEVTAKFPNTVIYLVKLPNEEW